MHDKSLTSEDLSLLGESMLTFILNHLKLEIEEPFMLVGCDDTVYHILSNGHLEYCVSPYIGEDGFPIWEIDETYLSLADLIMLVVIPKYLRKGDVPDSLDPLETLK